MESPSWDGVSFGWLESLDHYGLGSWDPGAGEDRYGSIWNWEDWDTVGRWEAVQPTQITDTVEGTGAAESYIRDTTIIPGCDILELEIQEEITEATFISPDLTSNSSTPSTSAKKDTSLVLDVSIVEGDCRRHAEAVTTSGLVRNESPLADEWLCNFPQCGRAFTHRHKLNRHRKYHNKPYRCLEPSCISRQVAFSLKKDLDRHQTKHNGHRFYCPNAGCRNALGGAEGGFTRRDNLKRHIGTKHP